MNITLPKLITQIKERVTTDLLLHISTEYEKSKKSIAKYFKISTAAIIVGIGAGILPNMPELPKILDFITFLLTFLGGLTGVAGLLVSTIMHFSLKSGYNQVFNINLENKEQLLAKLDELNSEKSKKELEEYFQLSKFSYFLKTEEIQALMNVCLNKAQIAYLKGVIVHKNFIELKDLEELSKLATTVKINAFLEDNQIQNSTVGKLLMEEEQYEVEMAYNKYI